MLILELVPVVGITATHLVSLLLVIRLLSFSSSPSQSWYLAYLWKLASQYPEYQLCSQLKGLCRAGVTPQGPKQVEMWLLQPSLDWFCGASMAWGYFGK